VSRHGLLVAIALLLSLCAPDAIAAVSEGGVGITAPPDSVEEIAVTAPYCPPWNPYHSTDRFWLYGIDEFNEWINIDIDLLIDGTFGNHVLVNEVEPSEAEGLLRALDLDQDNRFGWPFTDLAMAYNYFAKSVPYDSLSESHHFSLFTVCSDPSYAYEIDHLDLYLTPAADGHEDPPLPTCGAHTPSTCYDADEDPPGSPLSPEWHHNSVSVTDNFGNRGDDTEDWPVAAAHGAIHEFVHTCWNSNSYTYGQHTPDNESGDYNEFLACASEYLAVPLSAPLGGDLRYIYSVLHDSDAACKDPCIGGPTVKASDQRYHLWRLFGAYLGYQFNDPDSLQNALISRWARNVTTWENDDTGMERTFCGLARILDGEEFEEVLGHDSGADRVGQLFSNYGIARWVNHETATPGNPQPYYFGPDFSPCRSAGQFRKVDKDTTWSFNALWEYAIPPEFILDEDNVGNWTAYPASCPDDPDSMGWQDVTHAIGVPGIWHGCVPVQVDLWGSNYLVFRADTLEFGQSCVDTLVVQFDWSDTADASLMNPHAELWLSVLLYKASVDSLFLRGDRLKLPVTTVVYDHSTKGATVRVRQFRRNSNEAVVIVPTLVAADYDGAVGCVSRRHYADEPCVDLHYSYRFRVGLHGPGSGCPFVSSLGASGYTSDNNVLASAWAGGQDVLDTYLLRQKPDAVEGTYRLRFCEAADERSQFDSVDLLAVDHAAGTDVAVFPDGSVGTYTVTGQPVACRDQDGNDILDLVLRSDGQSATLQAGGWLDVVFRSGGETRNGGGVGEDGGPIEKVDPFGKSGRGDGGDGTLSLASQCYRANPCVSILDMPAGVTPEDGMITLRVTAPTDYKLDRLFTVERSEDPVVVTRCALSEAEHSESASCMGALAAEDGVYASLAKGDTIDLTFRAPAKTGDEREFVLLTRGGEVSRGGDETSEQPEVAAATISPTISPNPFNPSTTISFNVPGAGGRVAVSIYNMAGRLVRRLAETDMQSGQHTLTWDGRGERGENVGSGVYFCRIETPGQSDQKKLVLLK
jgi:hypothetical protein